MTFSWDINIGQIVSAAVVLLGAYSGALRIYHLLDKRMDKFEGHLSQHTDTLELHSVRMEKYESGLYSIVGDVQRILGRLERGRVQ